VPFVVYTLFEKTKPMLWIMDHSSWFIAKTWKGYLKKQTQFPNEQKDVKSILIMVYGVFKGPRRRKNKANSKPIL
jgi:hypothetical protein